MMHFNTNITNKRNKFNIEYEGYDTAKYPIRRIENNMITFDLFDGDNHFENLLNLSKLKMNLFTYQIAEIHKTNYEKINEIEREIFDIPISTKSNKKDLINTHTIITCNNNSTPVNFAINTLPRFSILYPYNQLENYPNKTMSNRETKIKSHLKSIVKMRNIYKSKIYVDKIIEHLELIKQNSYPSYKYQLLIFLILIKFSDDKAIYVSMMNLNRLGFNLNIISEIHIEDLINLISSVKFNIKKANHIKNLTQEILQKFNGNPPETFYDILNLPGMELKLAQIYLNIISETNKKIIVTSHVHRISNRLKWVKSSKYDETRLKLEIFLDIDLRAGLNFVLDVFGQKICKKENPKCGKCLLRDNCGYYKKTINKITKNNKDATSILITKDVSDKYDINDYQNKKREENFDDFEFF